MSGSAAALEERSARDLLSAGPPVLRIPEARATIRGANQAGGTRVIVLDDDPTGSQSVHGIPVLTRWRADDLRWAFQQPTDGFFILTNTRGLAEDEARATVSEVVTAVEQVSAELGIRYSLITRSDSTLRGHYPLETDVVLDHARRTSEPYDALLIAPAYLAAGRITVDDVHYVRAGDRFVPVGQTGYARDATFGFASSDIRDYIAEKTSGVISADSVVSLGLDDIRIGGPARVRDVILSCTNATPIVVNAVDASDLDVVVLGLIEAEAAGARVLSRTGPTFVAARLGIVDRDPVSRQEIFASGERLGHGLIIVGSHVELTTAQVDRLVKGTPELSIVELDVPKLVDPRSATAELTRCAAALAESVTESDTLLVTSRARIDGDDGHASLVIAQNVSHALSTLTQGLVSTTPIAWVLAKGGITSSDIATEGLSIRRATVAGQMFPGIVSVWVNQSDGADGLHGLPLIVFAGNVGDESTLLRAVRILASRDSHESDEGETE
jgi:uncharacterized protein YgbK (DUF1537 family)